MKRLYCYSKAEFDRKFDNNDLPKNSCFISIIDSIDVQNYYKEFYSHKLSESNNVINLQFDDVSEVELLDDHYKAIPISESQSNRLVDFIELNLDKDIYIHCIAGRSRSQGVVRFILDMWPKSGYVVRKENPNNTPNIKVLTELKRTYYKNYGFY